MSDWTPEEALSYFEAKFCHPASSTYLPLTLLNGPEELLPGTIFNFVVEHQQHRRCSARLYCGLAHHLGGRLWLQETQSLLRLNAKQHPALPTVREGIFRDDEGVGLVVSDATGDVLSLEGVRWLRSNPHVAFRYFGLVADALRTLHGYGLIHRDIWRGSFELAHSEGALEEDIAPYIRIVGFEMSAFVASLADPAWRTSASDRERLRVYRTAGGAERFACRAPEVVASELADGAPDLSYRSDVYSLGVCGYQWFVDDLPEDVAGGASHDTSAAKAEAFVSFLDERIAAATEIPGAFRDLLRRMIRVGPRTRPTAADVVSVLASIHDDVAAGWRTTEIDKPFLLSIAPRYLAQYIQIEEWKDLSTDEDVLFDELKTLIEKDLLNGVLVHEPRGAEGYVQGGDRSIQERSVWVLIGKRAAYFCQPFVTRRGLGGAAQHIDWALHINYVVDRCNDELTDIACVPLRRRVLRVKVVHNARSAEVDPKTGKGRHPTWGPLLDEVRRPDTTPDWHLPFRKGFYWWLNVQRGALDIRLYPYRRISQSGGSRALRLVWDADRDRTWIESGVMRHLLSKMRKRPDFGDFFGTLRDRDLGEDVTWHTDASGEPERRPVQNARAQVRRVSMNEVEIELADGSESPPSVGWLRPADDVAADILLQRQRAAVTSLFHNPQLMEALYQPRSFRGSRKAWEHSAKDLGGRAPEIVKDMLANFPFYALQGPPGTGKTTVVAHAVAAYLVAKPGARVLVSAQSHYALDELAERTLSLVGVDGSDAPVTIRVAGAHGERQVRESMQRYFDTVQARRRVAAIKERVRSLAKSPEWTSDSAHGLLAVATEWQRVSEKSQWEIQDRIWRGANLVFATCGTCTENILGHQDELDAFDWVIVEESAKAWPAELVMPLVLGHRWTLIGDHQQLPPFGDLHIKDVYEACLTSERADVRALVDDRLPFKATLELFKHLFHRDDDSSVDTDPPPLPRDDAPSHKSHRWPVDRLEMQFRMHDSIRKVIGTAFYPQIPFVSAPSLVTDEPTHGRVEPKFVRSRAVVWLDTHRLDSCRYESGQWRNEGEAALVAALLRSFRPSVEGAARGTAAFAVLSPYNQQNQLLKAAVSSEFSSLIHTTDSFQGREADIVVVSLVRTNDAGRDDKIRRLGHLASSQRANVLLSRAKRLLVIVGDFDHFRQTPDTPWPTVCNLLLDLKARVELSDGHFAPER